MILAILQARFSSSRLPGKVLEQVVGKPMLSLQIERVKRSKTIDKLVVATSTDITDNCIEDLCITLQIPCFRGNLDDVLDRFYQAAELFKPDHIVRLTGDCPLIDPHILDEVIEFYLNGHFDYASNTLEPTFPDGLDTEVFSFQALEAAWKDASLPSHREHVTQFFHQQPDRFKTGNYKNSQDLSHLRWTVDNKEDLYLIRKIYGELYTKNPVFDTKDVLDLLKKNPDLSQINIHITRNEGLKKSQDNDRLFLQRRPNRTDLDKRYALSQQMLERASKIIPLGTQTFSKSKTQYPKDVSPYFIKRGKGSHVWDVDGNEYIDFINSLAAVTLGYNDPDVTQAVQDQLEDGVIFSLPHELEIKVAEKIIDMVPCAEMVRFGKNGSDATAGAVRLARAYTGREHVAVCGYHGWQDWYIGSTSRNLGVPKATCELTHPFTYNDINSLYKILTDWHGQIGTVIMEPMNTTEPNDDFLNKVKELTHKHGALLIFDETITGFRFANGGAQEYFGVIPDLATFGKGLANGYPVSAIAGRADIMKLMEEIFFSFTFGGETLSLAAAYATMNKLQKEPVISTLWTQGRKIVDGVKTLIKKYELDSVLSLAGKDCWSFLLYKDTELYSQWDIKTLFLQEVFSRGILTIGSHNMSYSHSDDDIKRILNVYNEVFSILKEAIINKSIFEYLICKPLEPLFKVR